MYHHQSPSPGGGGQQQQWSANNPPSSQPQQWSPQPPNGQYTPRPQQIPPISQAIPQQPAMQTMQPQHPDQYRALPPPQQMYAPPYQPHPHMGYPPPQPAPRQRTAIACRYCRRRKIRCSGFDQSEDGRCTNCVRFSQECVFTPVHAQTQAFVPAHTVWRGQGPPPNTQLYGAYGQPLPQHGDRNQPPYPPQQQQPGQYPPPPQGYQQPPMYQQQPPPPQQQQAGQKRSTDEPHTPTLPPPPPGMQAQMGGSRDGQPFTYPEPVGLTPAGASPASSHASFNSAQPAQSSYYPSYPYEAPRASSSPQTFVQPAPTINDVNASAIKQQQQQAQAAQALRQEERTSHDTKQGDVTDGATTASPDAAKQEEVVYSTKKTGVDAGVQVNLIDTPAKGSES